MKKIFTTLVAIISMLSLGVTGFAAQPEEFNISIQTIDSNNIITEQTYSASDMSYDIVDKDGNVISTGTMNDMLVRGYDICSATVGVGETILWYPTNDTSGFKTGKNKVVLISLKTSAATSLTISLTNGGTSKDVTDRNPQANLVSGQSDYCKLSVKNTSSKSINVTGGTISWS